MTADFENFLDLPTTISMNIFEFVRDEFKKLPVVCQHFRHLCIDAYWFQKWNLVIDPHHIKPEKKNILLEHDQFRVKVPNMDALERSGIPWQHFGWLDLYIGTTDETPNAEELWNLVAEIMPEFSCVEISPAERTLKHPIVIDFDRFNVSENLIHFSVYGDVKPSLLDLAQAKLGHVSYVEINTFKCPDEPWLQPLLHSLPNLCFLDLWRCEWNVTDTPLELPPNLEILRMAYCSKQSIDFGSAQNLRIINMDNEQMTAPAVLDPLSSLYEHLGGEMAIVCPHLDHFDGDTVAVLVKVLEKGIKKIYLPRTDDEPKYQELINKISNATELRELEVFYQKPPPHFYANSPNAQTYRKLKTFGRLRGTVAYD